MMLFFGGMKNRDSNIAVEVEEAMNFRTMELSRIPNVGEVMNITIEDFALCGKVEQVFTTWNEPGNRHIKEGCHGESYAIMVKDLEHVGF